MAISTIGQNGLNAPLSLTSPTIATPTFTGQATIPTINLTGGQITFPATQSASSDANTLDDYEEGTFTPTASSSSGSLTSYTSSGRYIKIGQMVWVQCGISIVTSGTAGGSLSIGNFPFTYSGSNVNKNQLAGTVRETGQTGVYYGSFMNAGNNSITVQTLTAGAIVWTALYEYALYVCYQTT